MRTEVDHPARPELGLNGTRDVDGRLAARHAQNLLSALHHLELDRDDAGDLDGSAEGDLAVALGEVQVAHAELGALDVHGQVHFAAARQVLDVAVAAVFGTAGDGARALFANLGLCLLVRGAGVHALWFGGLGDDAFESRGGDKFGFAPVPFCEDLRGWRAAEDAWVDETSELDAGDVAGGAKDAFEVPDCLCGLGVVLVKETAAVVFVEYPGEAPGVVLEGLDVHDLYKEDVAGLGAFDLERSGEVVNLGEINVLDIVGAVIVLDLPTCPI